MAVSNMINTKELKYTSKVQTLKNVGLQLAGLPASVGKHTSVLKNIVYLNWEDRMTRVQVPVIVCIDDLPFYVK